jgi:DNA-binding SARP family transcriptional activator
MDTFWRDDEPESARRNLYQAIYLLRQALQQEAEDFPYVLSQNGTYTLNPDLNIWLDSEVFWVHYENGSRVKKANKLQEAATAYETADNIYSGDFLIDDPYDEWPKAHREKLRQAHLHILDCLSCYHYNQKNWAMCLTYYQRILNKDNCREDAHRGLMCVYYFQNQRHLALRQYHQCVEALQKELDVSPMPETTDLHQKIQKNQLHFSPTSKMNPD